MTPPAGSGILLVDKAAGITSYTVVAGVKRVLREPRVGHAGTLDPEATGLLPILVGEATKLMPYFAEHEKEYVATVQLGVETDTQDLAGTVRATAPVPAFDRATIERALRAFIGRIQQIPPMYSALHHAGRRLHELARRGIEVERAPRDVVVHDIVIEELAVPRLTLRVVCGAGTYVRTLAADLGAALGVGAALAALIRTRVGPFELGHAVPWSAITGEGADALRAHLRPPDTALSHAPEIRLDLPSTRAFLHGQSVESVSPASSGALRVYGAGGEFLGVGRRVTAGRVKPERILHADRPGTPVLPV